MTTTRSPQQTMPRGWRATARAVFSTHGLHCNSRDLYVIRRAIVVWGYNPVRAAEDCLARRRMYQGIPRAMKKFVDACNRYGVALGVVAARIRTFQEAWREAMEHYRYHRAILNHAAERLEKTPL